MANICKVSERTIRDWRREKYYMTYEAARSLSSKSSVPIAEPRKILENHWILKNISSIGAKRKYELYGNPGTPEGRRKGGLNSQRKFKKNPKYAENLGVNIRKRIKRPALSCKLAEFIGIMLGDGGLTYYWLKITFNREVDNQHSIYIEKLIRQLFNVSSELIIFKFLHQS